MSEPRPWEVLKSETLLDQAPWLQVRRQSVRLPNGVVVDDYVLTSSRDWSMIVAVTDAAEVWLVRQYKHGIGRVVLEFPAGYLDSPDEDPLRCAQRELREETGFEARHWSALGALALDPNRSGNRGHFFLARGLRQVADLHLDSTENLHPLAVPARAIPEMLRTGEINVMACAAAWGMAVGEVLKNT